VPGGQVARNFRYIEKKKPGTWPGLKGETISGAGAWSGAWRPVLQLARRVSTRRPGVPGKTTSCGGLSDITHYMMAQQGARRQLTGKLHCGGRVIRPAGRAGAIPLHTHGPAGAVASTGLISSDQAGTGAVRHKNDYVVAVGPGAQRPASAAPGAIEIVG
jgi:hypothetical protein